jgi:hypothetical protein
MRKRLRKKLWKRNRAMYFTLSKRGKTYPLCDIGMLSLKRLSRWARVFQISQPVDRTELPPDILVSTVFLAINHNYRYGTPLLFETMIFNGEHDKSQWRYTTIIKARRGHQRAVALARGDA